MRHSKFFTGVAVGVVIGILFAPDKGKNTRSKIGSLKGKATDFAEGLADNVEGIKNDLTDLINTGRGKIKQWSSESKRTV